MPFGLFLPQPVAGTAAAIMIVTQLWLVISGNFSWLNWLTIVLALPVLPDGVCRGSCPVSPSRSHADAPLWCGAHRVCASPPSWLVLSVRRSQQPAVPGAGDERVVQRLHLVNTYGAFGSITRDRYEIVIEGTR